MNGFTAATGLPMHRAYFVAQAGYRSYCPQIAIPLMPWTTPPARSWTTKASLFLTEDKAVDIEAVIAALGGGVEKADLQSR